MVPPLFSLRWLAADAARPRWRDWLTLAGVTAAVAGPWYACSVLGNTTFGAEHVWRHHVQRCSAHHQRPVWFFLPVLAAEWLPWTGLAVPAFLGRRTWPAPVRFAAAAAGWCFLFFSAARCKLPTYLLPLLPLSAVIFGHTLYNLTMPAAGRGPWRGRRPSFLVAVGFRHVLHAAVLGLGQPDLDPVPLVLAPLTLAVPLLARLGPRAAVAGLAGAAYLATGAACLLPCRITPHSPLRHRRRGG